MAIASVEQVRAVAEYAEYAAQTVRIGFSPRKFDDWVWDNYRCVFEDLGTA